MITSHTFHKDEATFGYCGDCDTKYCMNCKTEKLRNLNMSTDEEYDGLCVECSQLKASFDFNKNKEVV